MVSFINAGADQSRPSHLIRPWITPVWRNNAPIMSLLCYSGGPDPPWTYYTSLPVYIRLTSSVSTSHSKTVHCQWRRGDMTSLSMSFGFVCRINCNVFRLWYGQASFCMSLLTIERVTAVQKSRVL